MSYLYCVVAAWAGRIRTALLIGALLVFAQQTAEAQTETRCHAEITGVVVCNTEPSQNEKIKDAVGGIMRWKAQKDANKITQLTADWNDEARRFDAAYYTLVVKDKARTLNDQAILWGNLAVAERREAQFDAEKALDLRDKKDLEAAVLRIQSARLLLEKADAEPPREVVPEQQ